MMPVDRDVWVRLGRLWSLWDMLRLEVWRLLEAHETIILERGHFEQAARAIDRQGGGEHRVDWYHFAKLLNAVSDVAHISQNAKLHSTMRAATRTKQNMEQIGKPPDPTAVVVVDGESCGSLFRHLMDIASRIRDDCSARIYFQIAPENSDLLRQNASHFGTKVEKVFPAATEDIAEAAACLAFGRTTASVFHLMRAVEAAVLVMARRLRVKRINNRGELRTWGQLLPAIGSKIEALRQSLKKDEWLQAKVLLFAVNRSWRVKVAHPGSELRPKETYTEEQARTCFDTSKAFMIYLAELLEKKG